MSSLFLLCMVATQGESATIIEWTIAQTEVGPGTSSPPTTLTYTASDARTRIAGPLETILIDYQGARIFRLDSSDSSCRSYPFGSPHDGMPAAAWTVVPADEASEIRLINFGLQSALSQAMVVPMPFFYGQEFPLCQAEFRISRTLPHFAALLAIAVGHRDRFQDYPFLRRLDPMGMIEPLGGFPVSGSSLTPLGKTTMQMISPPKPISTAISVPQHCLRAY